MTLNELQACIREKLNPLLEQKQSGTLNIEVNVSQGGIGECYIQHKAKLVDKQIIND